MKQSSKSNQFSETAKRTLEMLNERRLRVQDNAPKCPYCDYSVGILEDGFDYAQTCKTTSCEQKFCKKLSEKAIKNRTNRATEQLIKFGVGKRFSAARMDDFPKTLRGALENTQDALIMGENGVGKSHLAAAFAAQAFIGKELYCVWANVPELLILIRSSFRPDAESTERQIIKRLCETDLLILDDLGAEKMSDFSLSTLYVIINKRHDETKPTIVTTNMEVEDVAEQEPRIASRIAGYKQIRLTGKDRRLKK